MFTKTVKTIEDVENAQNQMSMTFRVFWGVNALLTFVFGYEFIAPLIQPRKPPNIAHAYRCYSA